MKTTITEKKDQFLKQREALNYDIFLQKEKVKRMEADLHAVNGAIQACDILLKEVPEEEVKT